MNDQAKESTEKTAVEDTGTPEEASSVPEEVAEASSDEVDTATEADEATQDPLASLQEEVATLKDKLLRSQAETENIRRRSQKEIADARKFAIERFATELLDVVDNLERALAVEEGNEEALRDGVQLTLDAWNKVMGKFDMVRLDAMNTKFDPHHHEALSRMPHEAEEGTVIAQHCAGYTLHGRLIRPAKVLVSSGPAEA